MAKPSNQWIEGRWMKILNSDLSAVETMKEGFDPVTVNHKYGPSFDEDFYMCTRLTDPPLSDPATERYGPPVDASNQSERAYERILPITTIPAEELARQAMVDEMQGLVPDFRGADASKEEEQNTLANLIDLSYPTEE